MAAVSAVSAMSAVSAVYVCVRMLALVAEVVSALPLCPVRMLLPAAEDSVRIRMLDMAAVSVVSGVSAV